MKKWRKLVIIALMAIISLVLAACDREYEHDGYIYVVRGGRQTIIGYEGAVERLDIPKRFTHAPIAGLGPEAFKGDDTIIELTMEHIPGVGDYALSGMKRLETLHMPSLGAIGKHPLAGTENLTSLTIPGFARLYAYFGSTASAIPEALIHVAIGEKTTSVTDAMFKDAKNIATVALSADVESIGRKAFKNTSALETLIVERTAEEGITALSEWESEMFMPFYGTKSSLRVHVPACSLKEYRNDARWNEALDTDQIVALEE